MIEWSASHCVGGMFKNRSFTMPLDTTTFYLETAMCVSHLWPSLGYQHNILKHGKNKIHVHSPYSFTLWDHTSLQC